MTVLVDTSIWADHFRTSDAQLAALLIEGRVVIHPFVVGELAMGNLQQRQRTVAALSALPTLLIVDDGTWLNFVEDRGLGGSGLGFVDAHLLASTATHDVKLWTRDRRLAEQAARLGSAWMT